MRPLHTAPATSDVAAAALVAQPFALYLVVLSVAAPATASNWERADPIISLFPRALAVGWVPVLSVALAAAWWRIARPSRETLIRAAKEGCLGAVLACIAVGALRLAAGPSMPAFIPAEESAGPGYLLSMAAGYSEELVCRLALLPALYLALRQRTKPAVAAVLSILLTSLAFSLWHAAGEATPSSVYFATRFIVPGVAMSVAFFVSPSMIVVGHATAHLLIPALFV